MPTLTHTADGWRGIIGQSFTPDSVTHLVKCVGAEVKSKFGFGPILVSHDFRSLSEETAYLAASVLSGLGFEVEFAGAVPTPVVTFAVNSYHYLAAVLITASHNPSEWNGLKLKLFPGTPPSVDFERAVELRRREDCGTYIPHNSRYRNRSSHVLGEDLVRQILQYIDVGLIRSHRPRIIVDGLHGVAGQFLSDLLHRCGCDVLESLGTAPDSRFCGLIPDPMRSCSRQRLVEAVRFRNANVGFVTDGDGDRLGVIDETGEFAWPHDIFAALIGVADKLGPPGNIAVTVAVGSIIRRVAQVVGRYVIETPVGFKNIAPLFQKDAAAMGGGGVGDIGFRFHGYDRDPMLAAALLVHLMCVTGLSVGQLINRLHQIHGLTVFRELELPIETSINSLFDLGLKILTKAELRSSVTDVTHVDGTKFYLGHTDWLLLRNSTTENVIRLSIEVTERKTMTDIVSAVSQVSPGCQG